MFYSYPGIKVNTHCEVVTGLSSHPERGQPLECDAGRRCRNSNPAGPLLILKLSAKRRRVCRHVAPSGVGHDEHLGDGGLVDVRELEQPQFARAE
jgi:hypothetical protein